MRVLIILFSVIFVAYSYSQEIENFPFPGELIISTKKDTFFVYEEVEVDISLKNLSDQPVEIYTDKIIEYFIIHDSKDNILKNTMFIDPLMPDPLSIGPNEELKYFVSIKGRYRIPNEPDYYRISLKLPLSFPYNSYSTMYNHIIESNTLYIDVIEPKGEEYEPFWRYELAMKHLKAGRDSRACDNLKQIVEKFPNSFYAELAKKELRKFK